MEIPLPVVSSAVPGYGTHCLLPDVQRSGAPHADRSSYRHISFNTHQRGLRPFLLFFFAAFTVSLFIHLNPVSSSVVMVLPAEVSTVPSGLLASMHPRNLGHHPNLLIGTSHVSPDDSAISRKQGDLSTPQDDVLPTSVLSPTINFVVFFFGLAAMSWVTVYTKRHHMKSRAQTALSSNLGDVDVGHNISLHMAATPAYLADPPSIQLEAETSFPFMREEEVEELEILPVVDEEYWDEAFVMDYHKTRDWPPLVRGLNVRHGCDVLAKLPADSNTLRWVNVTGNQHSLTLPVLTAFQVHPLFVEDILHEAERSKVEKLGLNELVVVFQSVQLSEEDDPEGRLPLLRLEMNQISLVLKDRVLLSFFNSPSKTVDQCKACVALPGSRLRTSSCHWLVHMILDKEVDRLFPIMNRFRMQLEDVQQLLETRRPRGPVASPNSNNARILQVLQATSQEMNNLLFVLRPLASTVASLTEYSKQQGMTELQWHFDDLRDHIATILDYAASMQTWVKCLKDDYSYIQQENMQRTMYTLTLITALFVPAQFLTGLFGMNFQYMPWLNWEYGFWAFWGVILGISSFSIIMFKRIRWL